MEKRFFPFFLFSKSFVFRLHAGKDRSRTMGVCQGTTLTNHSTVQSLPSEVERPAPPLQAYIQAFGG